VIDTGVKKIVAVLAEMKEISPIDEVEFLSTSRAMNIDDRIQRRMDELDRDSGIVLPKRPSQVLNFPGGRLTRPLSFCKLRHVNLPDQRGIARFLPDGRCRRLAGRNADRFRADRLPPGSPPERVRRGGRQRIEKDKAASSRACVMACRWRTDHSRDRKSGLGQLGGDNGSAQAPSESLPPKQRKLLEDSSRPRPGHADLAGGIKYNHHDLRNVLERASARETAARVAAGSLVRQLLEHFGVRIASHVVSIGDVTPALESTRPDLETIQKLSRSRTCVASMPKLPDG